MSGNLTKMFQKHGRESAIKLEIKDDHHLTRTSYVYFMTPDRLRKYLHSNPAGNDRHYSLAGQDLSSADLSDLDLRRTNFSDAVLHDAVFSGTKLENANIAGADLTGAVFEQGQLDQTKGKPKYGPEGPLTAARISKMRPNKPESP